MTKRNRGEAEGRRKEQKRVLYLSKTACSVAISKTPKCIDLIAINMEKWHKTLRFKNNRRKINITGLTNLELEREAIITFLCES